LVIMTPIFAAGAIDRGEEIGGSTTALGGHRAVSIR
jgi:hypothetical protein